MDEGRLLSWVMHTEVREIGLIWRPSYRLMDGSKSALNESMISVFEARERAKGWIQLRRMGYCIRLTRT